MIRKAAIGAACAAMLGAGSPGAQTFWFDIECTGALVVTDSEGTETYDLVVQREMVRMVVTATSRLTGETIRDVSECSAMEEWCHFDLGEDGFYDVRLSQEAGGQFTYTERWGSGATDSALLTCEDMEAY